MLWAQLVAGTSRSGHFEYLVLGKYFPGYRNACQSNCILEIWSDRGLFLLFNDMLLFALH